MTIFIHNINSFIAKYNNASISMHDVTFIFYFCATRVIKFVINGKLSRNSPSYE